MIVTRTSMMSKIQRSIDLDVTAEQINAWRSGMLIQDAMPHLNEHEREFVISGITQEEWERIGEVL